MALEVRLHVICDLADAVANSVSDFGIGVITIFDDTLYDRLYIFARVHVLSDLRETHDGGILISPIVVLQRYLHDLAENREHDFLAYSRDQPVDTRHAESNTLEIGIFLYVIVVALLRGVPFGSDFLLDFDHVEEYHLDQLLQLAQVILVQFGNPLSDRDHHLSSHLLDALILDLLIEANLVHTLKRLLEVVLEKLRLALS